ncbi:tetratricopeptide repeat protein [Buchnera aphidicola (Brachycaudus cardui)]|uniref:Ancillary SecYEG translocon subunit n=1 Tax=Buchnera aphidicola (Brachycaudus cardui) TaxID=557993 RepID=A0A4D6XVG0_9GAMM|nr:tetratricopeptide repeat protein [Buchnera aphidicola]QCI20723.1 tetratricopeptide repeat protein [Buchnera aphidicola (Brachycaudus cardui)]
MFNFFKTKIIFFIIFFIIFSIILCYWKYSFKTDTNNLNPLQYENIIKEININKPTNLNKAETFIIQNKNIYGTLTAMFLAKKYVLKNDFQKAIIQLNNSLKYTKEENLRNILKIRITKITIQQKEYKKSINILKTINDHNWSNIIENIKGDIFFKQNNKKAAIKAWEKSLFLESSNASKEIINMKLNELK